MNDLSDAAEFGKLYTTLEIIRDLATNRGSDLVDRLLPQCDSEDMDRIAVLANRLISKSMAEFDRIAAEAAGEE